MNQKVGIAIVVVAAILFIGGMTYVSSRQASSAQQVSSEEKKIDTPSQPVETSTQEESSTQVAMEINQEKTYSATLHTSEGDVIIALNAKETPITVNNFVTLSRKKFYDTTIFHRVIKGFMIQGGDPKGDGTGGPGYRFDDEPFKGEYTKGTVAMANSGPNTNGSQFFIMHDDVPLPKNYVIFGSVAKGIEVIDKIASAEVAMSPSGEPSKPIKPVVVTSVEIKEE